MVLSNRFGILDLQLEVARNSQNLKSSNPQDHKEDKEEVPVGKTRCEVHWREAQDLVKNFAEQHASSTAKIVTESGQARMCEQKIVGETHACIACAESRY